MIRAKVFTLAMIFIALIGVVSCGSDDEDDPAPSQREMVLDALASNWSIDVGSSSFGNTVLNGSSVTASFNETGFTFGGEISTYVSGGSYIITDSGTFSDVSLNIASSELVVDGSPRVSLNSDMTQITIEFSFAESGGRLSGIGGYTVIFNR